MEEGDRMKEKSLSGNIVLNAIKTFMSIGFPLISFPYISRILQVENIGKVNFVISIINYYSLVATLGLTSYAIREGSIIRNDIKKRSHLFDELFSLNVITTIVAYILLGISLVWIPSFQEYRSLLLIYSLTMLFNAIGVGWACSVFEDYLFITVRSIIFQFLALVMMFLFIHKQEDYYKYTWIMVFQVAGTGVSNLLHVSKVHRFKFTTKIDLKKHIKPVLTLFATEIATTIYVSSDTTVIGFLAGDYYNGLYAVSTKIYRVAKQMLAAILQVAIPRLSNYYNNGNMKDFEDVIQEVGEMLILVLMPIVVGIFYCAKPIIILLSGIEYTEAYVSLQILSISLVFAIIAWFLSQCVIVPKKMESLMLKTTAFSASVNLVLNILLIPYGKQNAAAFTTMISEAINAGIYLKYAYLHLRITELKKQIVQCGIACVLMIVFMSIIRYSLGDTTLFLMISILGCSVIYILTLLIERNSLLFKYLHAIENRIKVNRE